MRKALNRDQVLGLFYFIIFLALIIAGIVAKRMYGHPDWMVFFHLPAAVFLVLAGRTLSAPIRARHRMAIAQINRSNRSDQRAEVSPL